MNDGSILRWIANLDRFAPTLKDYNTYLCGHGIDCDYKALQRQKEYFNNYCSEVLVATKGMGIFNDDTRKTFEQSILAAYPRYGCQFMVALSADAVSRELVSLSH